MNPRTDQVHYGAVSLTEWLSSVEESVNAPSLLRGRGAAGIAMMPVRAAQIFVRKSREIGLVQAVRMVVIVVGARAGVRR